VIGYEERRCKKLLLDFNLRPFETGGAIYLRMVKSKRKKNKAKLNLTVREEQRNKLEQMASLENRYVSNFIEVMADELW
jgi:hypothetical protein